MFDTTDELLRQIRLGEDSSLELKNLRYRGTLVAEPRRDDIADEFAAMANSATGVFVFGIDDKTKTIDGIPTDKLDAVETWIREICNDLIKPQLFCRIRKIPVTDEGNAERVLIRVDIPRSLFVHKSPSGYFHRIGSSKREMEPDVLARLFQQRSQARLIRFDEQVVMTAPENALNKTLWGKFKTPLSPDDDAEFLLKLKLLSYDGDGGIFPTVSGVLMAAEKPHEFITNAFIQAVAYRGEERNAAYQLDAKDIVGTLDTQIAAAYQFVERNMQIYAVKEPARRDIPQFAMNAVFEALVNAVAHRDYSIQSSKVRLHLFADRLEVFSPGTITNTMTLDSLPLRQSARNELLASLLARCPLDIGSYTGKREFLMDKRGEGVPIILSESEKLSGRRPEYRLIDNAELLLTIFAAKPPQ
ncbi:MAG: putative DNA binding domain-containing protein [Puniceicoccales bacterium]|jgi:predicted HTH transcriptional regulator|nr:putative DNA binding domain-containing protein [Puniceicoccales bacterium]